jgi:enoyl-CoA hydratase/carnithine racemase
MTAILTHQRNHLFEIVLNRPDKRNAIDWSMLQALGVAIDQAEQTPGVRAVLIRAEGSAFSVGLDLTGLQGVIEQFGDAWRENLFPVTAAMQHILNRVEACSLPVIALLHGYCLGLGMELALACDFRIAAEGVRLGLPETRLGLIPDVGGTTRLTRLIGAGRAKELILTGKQIDTALADRWGIVNHVVPAEALLAKGEALAAELAEAAPLAVSYAKRVINELGDTQRGLNVESWAQSVLMRSQDFEIGAAAVLTKQKPVWTGK